MASWPWKRRSAEALALREPIEHLLIVAGPHGSGKSTFLNLLAADALPDEIKALVPPGADRWVQTSVMKVFKPADADTAAAGKARSVALHYNILRPHVRGLPDYASDPSLELIGLAEQVTVVTLRPPLPRLISQFAARSAVQQAAAPWPTRARRHVVDRLYSPGRAVLPTHMRRILSVPSDRTHDLSGRFGRVVRLYQEPGWLEECYARWHAFLEAAAASKRLRAFQVEPVEVAGIASYRVLSARPASPPASEPNPR